MLDHILAKRRKRSDGTIDTQSLIEHTEFVLEHLQRLKHIYPEFDDEFWRACFKMCLYHDIGKVSGLFQKKLFHQYRDVFFRHELLSCLIVYVFDESYFTQNPLSIAAIYSHHKPLASDLTERDNSNNIDLNEDDVINLYNWIRTILNEPLKPLNKDKQRVIPKLTGKNQRDLYNLKFLDKRNIEKFDFIKRSEYIKIKAILTICDWSASSEKEINSSLSFNKSMLLEQLGKRIKKKIISLTEFQSCSLVNKNVIAIAPTGSGKTEAALHWASQKKTQDKVIYCLPTRVTSNSIFQRLTDYFGEENTSLVHSSAFLFRKEENPAYREYTKDKTFFKNITVCTIDQLLTMGFNLGYWELKSFHCRNARIIIDEIHLYDAYTLGLISKTISYLNNTFSAKFYIMSATMPIALKSILKNILGANTVELTDDSLFDQKGNVFETRSKEVIDNIEEIKLAIKDGIKKILVVVNTVDQAIDIFRELEKLDHLVHKLICFHARFCQKDRLSKEKEILEYEKNGLPIVLIATQVVEVTLDIDYNILFTENAPIDALIQRSGRVNRKRDPKKTSHVIVHQHSKVSQENIYKLENVLDKSFDEIKRINQTALCERMFRQMVNRVYSDYDISKNADYNRGLEIYSEVQEAYFFIGDCPIDNEKAMTREFESVSVVPIILFEEFMEEKDQTKKVGFELSVSKNRYQSNTANFPVNNTRMNESNFYRFINGNYSTDVGLEFLKKDKSNNALTF